MLRFLVRGLGLLGRPRPHRVHGRQLHRCQAAPDVEPGIIALALDALGQPLLRELVLPELQLAQSRKASRPEMVRLAQEGEIEMTVSRGQFPAFELLSAGQEVIDRALIAAWRRPLAVLVRPLDASPVLASKLDRRR